jgi:alkylation response protein AidB-like acyl-CoA dehydrogenase
MPAAALPRAILRDETIAHCGQRAAGYDRDNRFFAEDFAELRAAGYLLAAVPETFGGLGLSLADVCQEQRRLAYRAPATALATNMHLYWTGVAADLYRAGDTSLVWLLEAAMAGDVFAAGHGEAGNDLPLSLSTTRAERVAGGYRLTGHKLFGSLSPVWTWLGVHGLDASDPDHPRVVHAFLPRDAPGYEIKPTWDTLGMRATRSDDVRLNGVFIPDRNVTRVLAVGETDYFLGAVLAWALLPFGNIYYAIALRARDLAVAAARKRASLAVSRSLAYHPVVQHTVAAMTVALDATEPHLDRVAQDWSAGGDHGAAWRAKIVSAKYHADESAKRVVDLAMDVAGGDGLFKTNELERLYRDVRCGGFHPANAALVHEIVGKTTSGIDLGEQPRWG